VHSDVEPRSTHNQSNGMKIKISLKSKCSGWKIVHLVSLDAGRAQQTEYSERLTKVTHLQEYWDRLTKGAPIKRVRDDI